jgi:aminoglycoside phosphotransferase (APT) family kinase protein
MDLLDQPSEVRLGEELDTAPLESFLKRAMPDLEGDLSVHQFPSGYSNLTYRIRFGDRDLVLRRPPFGRKPKSGHDMKREYTVLRALWGHYRYAPRPLVFSDDESILGAPFLVMERLRGIILRRELTPGLALTPAQARSLCERLVDVQVELHALDYRALGLEGFGKPEGYVRRQVLGWCDRYRRARTDDAPDCEEVMTWLVEKMPPESPRSCVIHNDFKLDNVVLDESDPLRIVGVLDWEMATLGDPLMDLGSSMGYWVQSDDPPELQATSTLPTGIQGALTRREVVQRYAEKSGLSVENFDFYYCFGLFRLAGIAQQIYYRFYHGQTQDQRFERFKHAVRGLDEAARRLIAGSTL